ncbi:hypothetical protein [Oceanobacillus chungangensis]|uniref:Uncharacterized protein n=1 Tax=Oceanobacillus chungangensis TaxID=1229152 RepID=A0A3D8PU97_9BACI|nr:hypothetical protein [Oceanobacillus chungangensis]RDW19730.1 hypothetical protein CWR45_06540 [Oceanobacillus chungangensis]
MFLELLNELLSDFSPIYLYLSFLLSVVYFDYIQLDFRCSIDKNHAFIRRSHALKVDSLPIQQPISGAIEIHNWLTNKTKRIEIPDDDNDAHSNSTFSIDKNRGGQKWKKHLYSRSLKNIKLDFCSC